MKFGTYFAYWTHEWRGDYMKYARKVKDLGFDILEVAPAPLLEMSDAELGELKALTKDLGISITTNYGPPKDKDIASKDYSVRANGIRYLTQIMETMDKIDSGLIMGALYSYWPYDYTDLDKEALWDRSVESVKQLGFVAKDLGISYCLEVLNRFETILLNTCEEALKYCDDVGVDSVKVHLDTFHMNIEEDNIPNAIRLAGDRLGHLHVGEGNRKLPGKGSMPWEEIGQALKDIHYDKGVVMEPFVMQGGQVGKDIKIWRDLSNHADEATLDREIKESLIFLKRQFHV